MRKLLSNYKNLIIFFLILVILSLMTVSFELSEIPDKNAEMALQPTKNVTTVEDQNPCKTCTNPDLKPFIWNSNLKLTTPLMSAYSSEYTTNNIDIYGDNYTIPLRIEFNIFHGWEYKNYGFPYSSDNGTITNYIVTVSYMDNPRYSMSFFTLQSEFGNCDFNNKYSDDSVFQINVTEYQTVNTNFGELRVGKTDQENSPYVVCQRNVVGLESKTSDWVDLTSIGKIEIKTPENPDPKIYADMLEILGQTKVTFYTPEE